MLIFYIPISTAYKFNLDPFLVSSVIVQVEERVNYVITSKPNTTKIQIFFKFIYTLLQKEQLSRSTVAEEANVAEIQRLASNAAEMQAELAFRPTRADIDDLTAVVGKLRADLLARDRLIERLQASAPAAPATADRAVETTPSLEDLTTAADADADADADVDARQISADIDEMFRLDYDDDEETDSAATEINKSTVVSEYVRLDDDERLQVTQNGTLHVLVEEEELVRAKERLVEVCGERDRLAAQLAAFRGKHLHVELTHAAAFVVPLLLACLFYWLLPYVS